MLTLKPFRAIVRALLAAESAAQRELWCASAETKAHCRERLEEAREGLRAFHALPLAFTDADLKEIDAEVAGRRAA